MQEKIKNVLDKHIIFKEDSWLLIILLPIFAKSIKNSKELDDLLTKIEKNETHLFKKEILNNE